MDSRKMVPALLLVLLLIAATDIGPVIMKAEARHCDSQSHKFKGSCFSDSNCAFVCHNEGFPHGVCKTHHLQRKCFCRKAC